MFAGTRPRDTMSMAFWRIVRLLVFGIEARTERPSSIVETGLILPVAMSDILDSSSYSPWYMSLLKGVRLVDVLNSLLNISGTS